MRIEIPLWTSKKNKMFLIRLTEEDHIKVKRCAFEKGWTMTKFVTAALHKYMEKK